jgi:hypothetical protein
MPTRWWQAAMLQSSKSSNHYVKRGEQAYDCSIACSARSNRRRYGRLNHSPDVAIDNLKVEINPGSEVTLGGQSTCHSTLMASSTCTYYFLPGNREETLTAMISGSNTAASVPLTITVGAASSTTIDVLSTGTIPVNSGISTFTIINTGPTYHAYNVHALLPSDWTGVIQDSSNCATIAPKNGRCTLTFFSATPYIAQGNIAITGDNISSPQTTAFAFTATENKYLIWAVSDNKVNVIDTADLLSEQWGEYITTGAESFINGFSNTLSISKTSRIGQSAAASCYNSTNGNVSKGTWYLPAICEMNYLKPGEICVSSDDTNINTNLVELGFGGLTGSYWSSTESSVDFQQNAFFGVFPFNGSDAQYESSKHNKYNVRCVRTLML